MADASVGDAGRPERASTLDLLKLLAVVAMIIDHIGLYFLPEQPILRVLGRPAALIFGFLIGYSGATRVPPSWIGLGLGLTLLERALSHNAGGDEDDDDEGDGSENGTALDILIALALTRIVMPFFAALYALRPIYLVAAGLVLALAVEATNEYFEYGSEIVLMALIGLTQRLGSESIEALVTKAALVGIATVAIAREAVSHFGFEAGPSYGLVGVIAATILLLAAFRRVTIAVPEGLDTVLQFVGRQTLWIYAIHLAAFQIATQFR